MNSVESLKSTSEAIVRPNIYGYLNFRDFLKEYVLYYQARSKTSARAIARAAQFKNPGYIVLVIEGKRGLSLQSAERLALALALRKEERLFFIKLVQFSNEKNPRVKDAHLRHLMANKKFRELHALEAHEYEFYTRWYSPIVYTALTSAMYGLTDSELAKRLGVSPIELKETLMALQAMNLVERGSDGWRATNIGIKTRSETKQLNVRRFHQAMLKYSITALDETDPTTRDVQSVTLTLTKTEFEEMKIRVQRFIQSLFEIYVQKTEGTGVYQVSAATFKVLDIA